MCKISNIIPIIVILISFWGCKKPYEPPVITKSTNYLVVEGVVDPGTDSTIIRLSRTVQLSSKVTSNPELNATVVIESDANTSYPMTETENGYYVLPGLNASSSNKYRIRIITSDKKTYQSDYVPVKNSLPMDSVYFVIKNNGLYINADSHDATHNTTYYRWTFNETWEFHSAFYSSAIVSHVPKDTVYLRAFSDQIYTCWKSNASSNIILGSSAKLSQDIIANNTINFIPSNSEKLSVRYSILVKQYALTKDAYSYWGQLKKNTEQLGSIFDPQPSEISGNIHCISDPAEHVLGYISAGSPGQSRIFITTRQLPSWLPETPYKECKMDTSLYFNPSTHKNDVKTNIYSGYETPLFPLQLPGSPAILGYIASSPGCADCTLRGTNKQPSFW